MESKKPMIFTDDNIFIQAYKYYGIIKLAEMIKVPRKYLVERALKLGIEKDIKTIVQYCGIRVTNPAILKNYPGRELWAYPINMMIELIKIILTEMYVLPDDKKKRLGLLVNLKKDILNDKNEL